MDVSKKMHSDRAKVVIFSLSTDQFGNIQTAAHMPFNIHQLTQPASTSITMPDLVEPREYLHLYAFIRIYGEPSVILFADITDIILAIPGFVSVLRSGVRLNLLCVQVSPESRK